MKNILLTVSLALCLGAGLAQAQPYENSSVVGQVPDRLVITINPGVTMALTKTNGLPQVGVPALDALAVKFAAREMGAMYEGMTAKLDKATKSHFDRVWTVDFPANVDIKAAYAAYAALPEIEEVRRVDICKSYGFLPNDPNLNSQWYLRNMNIGGGDVRAVGAWNQSLGDSNIVICILDSGVDWHHPDLGGPHPDKVNGAIWTNWTEYYGTPGLDDDGNGKIDDIRGWDFVNLNPGAGWPGEDVTTPDNDPMDFGSHGTNCAGMAAGITDNGIGIASVAPGCKIMPVRCGYMLNGSNQGLVRMDFVSAGMLYASQNGANVINCSWGSSSFISFAVSAAQSAGVLLVTAAGNDNSDTDPALGVPSYLSTYPGVIAVAATNSSDGKSSFSNFGNWVELSAPGSGIHTTAYDASTNSHAYATVSGTSFSSPITCGAAAMIWSANPGLSASQVANALYSSADNIDAQNPFYVGKLGAGRVNLLRALGDNVQQYPAEFPTIFDALNSAASGDTIAIAAGTVLAGPLTIPGKGLKVFGGYNAGYTTRDPLGTPTTIQGPANSSVLKFSGTVDPTTEVDGFLITGGGGSIFGGIPYFAEYGGGVMLNGTSPTLRNMEITGNSAGDNTQLGCGGGLAIYNASPVLENLNIHGNSSIYGSGVYAYQSNPVFKNCTISNNPSVANSTFAHNGGGFHALDTVLSLEACTITGHPDQANGGGIYLAGNLTSSTLNMLGGEISGNSADANGGGIYINGGSLNASGVLITGNTKTLASTFMNGGGIFATAATVSLDSLTCTNNQSMVGGGMALQNSTSASVTNSTIAGNSAQFWGGGLEYSANAAGSIVGNTITGNDCPTGGAGLYVTGSAPVVSNNIAAFNTGGASFANGMALLSAPTNLTCNDVFGNAIANYSGQPDPTGTNGNIALDPGFCNAATSDFTLGASSPCAPANSGACGLIGSQTASCTASPVPDDQSLIPVAFRIEQNFPNPFNPSTTIKFALPTAGRTQIHIYDLAGRHVRTLLDEDMTAEVHSVVWSGDDDEGHTVSAGVYFYKVSSGDHNAVGRMALVK